MKRIELNHTFNSLLYNYKSIALITAITAVVFAFGVLFSIPEYMLAGTFVCWIYGMLFGFINLYQLYAYAIMQFMLFVFFLSRPVIATLYNIEWTYWSKDALTRGLASILLCEIMMLIGARAVKQVERLDIVELQGRANEKKLLQSTLLVMVVVSGVVCVYSVMSHYMAFKDLPYESMYIYSDYYEPAFIRGMATLFPFAVFSYLATLPPKREAIFVMGGFIILGLPNFLLGNRASLVLRIAFVVTYFFTRDYVKTEEASRWITKKLKIFFPVFVIVAIAFLGAYNYMRAGKTASDQTYIPIMLDFFYRQGTTFDTLCQGFQYEQSIRALPHNACYSLGPMIDTVYHSTISQKLFHTPGMGSGNSLNMVLNGNSLAHKLSYVVLGEDYYLSGHGRGSSFLLELYYDGGLPLIGSFSCVLGVFLANINRIFQTGKWFKNTITLIILSKVFYIHRSSTSDIFSFLLTPHFWLMILAVIIAKKYMENIEFRKWTIRLHRKKTGII